MLPIVYGHIGTGFNPGLGRQDGLTAALAAYAPVVLLERSRHAGRVVTAIPPRVEEVCNNVFVVRDAYALRFTRVGRHTRRVGAWLDGFRLNAALARAGFPDYVYWLTMADPLMLPGMRTDRLVYDCIDPCFDPSRQASVDDREFAIARRARLVFCTAQTLLERMRPVNAAVHLLPNACSVDTLAVNEALPPRPKELVGRHGPVAGYLGTLDWRIDTEALTEAATRLPDYTFAIVGRVNGDQEHRVARLRALPNVLLPGSVSYEDGHAWAMSFDVGLIPFLAPMGDGINPCKMYMYLANGKPVVSTWINECVRHGPWVAAARTPGEFAAAVRRAVEENSPTKAAARIHFASQNRWDDRAGEAVSVLRRSGILPATSGNPFAARPAGSVQKRAV